MLVTYRTFYVTYYPIWIEAQSLKLASRNNKSNKRQGESNGLDFQHN